MAVRTIIHVDMNAYFASVAKLLYPEYKNMPLAVGGKSSKSIISTASYEARAYGVNSAMPVYMAKRLCPNLVIVNPDFKQYEKYTNWFVSIIKKYVDKLELASIDECYADISEHLKKTNLKPLQYIKAIQDDIYKTTGLSCSIGVGPNKFLAKMGSDYKKPMGITVIRKRDIEKILWPLPIEDMYGCGKKTYTMLKNEYGINTIGDFANYYSDELKKRMGKMYDVLHMWANGQGSDEVSEIEEDAKSIGTSRTLHNDTNSYEELLIELEKLAKEVEKRAKKVDLYGSGVSLSIRYSDFSQISRAKTTKEPFNDSKTILKLALQLFDANYDVTRNVRLLGVTLINVANINTFVRQLSIFDKEDQDIKSNDKINAIINSINKKLGEEKLIIASKIKGGKK